MMDTTPKTIATTSVVATPPNRKFRSRFFTLKYKNVDAAQLCDYIVNQTSSSQFIRKTFVWVKIFTENDNLRALLHTHECRTIRSLKCEVFQSFQSLEISYIRTKEEFKSHSWFLEHGGYISGKSKQQAVIASDNNDKSSYIRQIRSLIDEYGVTRATIKIYQEYEKLVPYVNQVIDMHATVTSLQYMCDQQSDAAVWLKTHCYSWQQDLLKLLSQDPDDRKIIYIYDTRGNTGKTTFKEKYLFAHFEDTVCLMSFKSADMLHVVSKTNARVIFIDIQRVALNDEFNQLEHVNWGTIENIKNGSFMSPKYNSAFLARRRPHVVIFSNFLPSVNVWSLDRWLLGEINVNDKTMEWKMIPNIKHNNVCTIEDFETVELATTMSDRQVKKEGMKNKKFKMY